MPSPTTPLSGENDTTVGAAGATVSIVTLSALEAALTLPKPSITLAVKAWLPSTSVAVVKLHAPLLPARVVPILVAPSNISTVVPAAPVPLNAICFMFVIPSPLTLLSGENDVTNGTLRPDIVTGTFD